MFYSHEILTSRKHGVATIWLVATLGSRSTLKKVSKRAILDVDVPKACETICDPESPMALRLQSSLLYGVSRVYSQQCGYIWTDIQELHDKMRGLSLVIRDLQIDTGVAQISSDQLNLPFDPGFNFELDLGFDLSDFGLSPEQTETSSLLSPGSLASTHSTLLPIDEIEHQLDLLLTGTPDNGFLNFDLDAGIATSSIHRPAVFAESALEEPGIDEYPLFDIDEDGGIIDRPFHGARSRDLAENIAFFPNLDDDPAIEARVTEEHAALADIQGTGGVDNDDDGAIFMGDENDDPNEHTRSPLSPRASIDIGEQQELHHITSAGMIAGNESVDETAEAPQRRTRATRPLQVDNITELSNRQLSEWQGDYLENMVKAKLERAKRQAWAQARRNAAFWVLDQGIGGAATSFGDDREPHPLAVFSGQTLFDALTGSQSTLAGTKRLHNLIDSDTDEEEDARRVRSGTEENVGRGNNQIIPGDVDDGTLFHGDDDVESQVGRHHASSLKDQPSSMPWNLPGSSLQGSIRGSAQPGRSSSIRGIGFDTGLPSIMSGRRSRLTSASPLVGRGKQSSRLASLDPQPNDLSFAMDEFEDPYAGLTGVMDVDFELYGPAGVVSTQQAAQSQWLNAALENEAHNFLMFLDEQLAKNIQDDGTAPTITFEQLLPPRTNSNIVAAQGILHVLALATKGLITLHQDEAFGDISLGISKQRDRNVEDEGASGDEYELKEVNES